MNQQTKDQIINDLIRNRPKGPGDTKIEYSISSEYCYRAGRYKNVVTPMVAGFANQNSLSKQDVNELKALIKEWEENND